MSTAIDAATAQVLAAVPERLRPLHYRADGSSEVEISWCPDDNTIWLAYRDRKEPVHSFIAQIPNHRALDAFGHPNDYRPLAVISNFA
jgi:hypothetical protein